MRFKSSRGIPHGICGVSQLSHLGNVIDVVELANILGLISFDFPNEIKVAFFIVKLTAIGRTKYLKKSKKKSN